MAAKAWIVSLGQVNHDVHVERDPSSPVGASDKCADNPIRSLESLKGSEKIKIELKRRVSHIFSVAGYVINVLMSLTNLTVTLKRKMLLKNKTSLSQLYCWR